MPKLPTLGIERAWGDRKFVFAQSPPLSIRQDYKHTIAVSFMIAGWGREWVKCFSACKQNVRSWKSLYRWIFMWEKTHTITWPSLAKSVWTTVWWYLKNHLVVSSGWRLIEGSSNLPNPSMESFVTWESSGSAVVHLPRRNLLTICEECGATATASLVYSSRNDLHHSARRRGWIHQIACSAVPSEPYSIYSKVDQKVATFTRSKLPTR